MRLRDVISITQARTLTPDYVADDEAQCGFASDLMSDVLRFDLSQGLLVSGLANPQVVRTAEMADVTAILMVRGKVPPSETLEVAAQVGIPMFATDYTMFEACGKLFASGLAPARRRESG